MSQRAVFLDRDNTIIDNDGYLGDPSQVKLLPGAAAALVAMRGLGYRLIVVSNQSGVARGMFKESDVEAVNDEMSRQLKSSAGAYIDASYYCPYHPEAPIIEYRVDHDWRKPKCGMLRQAATDFDLDLAQCWMVGDQGRDVEAGLAAGCRTILLRDPDRVPAAEVPAVTPNFVVRTLADAARILAREGRNPAHAPAEAVSAPRAEMAAPAQPAAGSPSEAPAASPTEPVAPAASPAAQAVAETPPQAQEEAIADRVAQKLARQAQPAVVPATSLERHLEDLVIQLRNQGRNADLRQDFSQPRLAALILQVLAVAVFIVALVKFFTMKVTFVTFADIESAILANLGALFWVAGAVFLQCLVVTLLLFARER